MDSRVGYEKYSNSGVLKVEPKYGFIKIAENPDATDKKTLKQKKTNQLFQSPITAHVRICFNCDRQKVTTEIINKVISKNQINPNLPYLLLQCFSK